MTLTRWKAMAGLLGLGIGGLAAFADPPSTAPILKSLNGKPCPACPVVTAPPIPVPLPNPAEVPQLTPAMAPAPLVIPSIPAEVPVQEVATPPAPTVPKPTASVIEIAPMPRLQEVKTVEFVIPSEPETRPAAENPINTTPAVSTTPVVTTIPMATAKPVSISVPVPSTPAAVPPTPPPAPMPVTVPEPARVASAPPPLVPELVKRPTPEAASPSLEKKLKVLLHMSDERPRFEVRDGDEVYLKVICDSVEVNAPNGRTDNHSTMRAIGRCAFVTPGGDGFCDELSVVPGTGLVMVSGNVRFRYQWGRAETEVSGDKMTFRLGNTPGMLTPLESRGTTDKPAAVVPTSYSPKK